MSEIEIKVKNNPSYFAKPNDFTKSLTSYSAGIKQEELLAPVIRQPFDNSGKSGVPLYYDIDRKKIYVDHTDKHTIIIGPTAAKKSRLIAMPTVRLLGVGNESMVISDPKAEIYLRTADYLKTKGYEIKVLNLREPQYGSAWNPLYVPYMLFKQGNIDRAYEFANDIAVNLTMMDKSNNEMFWDNSAGSFFFGLILLLFKYCKENNEPDEAVNIGNIIRLRNVLCNGNSNSIRNNALWLYGKTDNFIASTLIGTLETANDTRAGILSVFDQKMRAFSVQPSLLDMLSHNDINYESLFKKPTAFFLILPDEKTGYHGLVSLFVKQSYEYLIFKAQDSIIKKKNLGNRVNYILDEFSSLPTINDFSAMITAARSRNIRFNLFLQSKHQLKLRYGEESDTIMSNCENWIFLTSREIDFLKEVSELCGMIGGTSQKPVLSVSELQRLDKSKGEALLLSGRNKPFITRLADIDSIDAGIINNNLYEGIVQRNRYEINYKITELMKEEIIKSFPHLLVNQKKDENSLIDALINNIDRKLEELEKQEKELIEKQKREEDEE